MGHGEHEFASAEEVLNLCTGSIWTPCAHGEVRGPCPSCGDKDSVQFNLERGFGHCWRPRCKSKFNYTSYYAAYYGISNKEAKDEILKRLNRNDGEYLPPPVTKVVQSEVADIEKRHEAYSQLQNSNKLSSKHIKDMKKRGLTEEEIKTLDYFSTPQDLFVTARKIQHLGISPKGIPGFFKQNGDWQLAKPRKGIFIPFHDYHRRIQGYQIRIDEEELRIIKGKKEKKCRWLSTKKYEDGCGPNSYVHWACDFYYDWESQEDLPHINDKTLYLIEGGMKGDICHILTKEAFICIAGVYGLDEFEKSLKNEIKALGVEKIVDCLDMDYINNPDVADASEKIKNLVTSNGYAYERKLWDENLKGYDDYLMFSMRNVK